MNQELRQAAAQAKEALGSIASMPVESDEWDAVEKYDECKAIAAAALSALSAVLEAPTGEARSGSGVPARPTLPGELPVTLAPLPDCHCEACDPIQPTRVEGGEFVWPTNLRMIVCAICGNKRCPHATDHRLACTNSNDSGQPGSSYSASKAVFVERALAASPLPQEGRWQPIATRPDNTSTPQTYLVTDGKMVAPWIGGVIHNNPGTPWDWKYGETITHWMPLPAAPGTQGEQKP